MLSDSLNSYSVYNVDKEIFPLSAVPTTNTLFVKIYAVQRRGSDSEVLISDEFDIFANLHILWRPLSISSGLHV